MCEEKIFRSQSMPKAIICIEKGLWSRILEYLVWSWFQLKLSENENPARKNWFKVAIYDKSFILFPVDRYELMA